MIRTEKTREYDRKRDKTPARRERRKQYRRDNPDKYRAHYLTSNAVRDGKLVKKPCAFCKSGTRLHGHHHDYSKPLDVTWLCIFCHNTFHSLMEKTA